MTGSNALKDSTMQSHVQAETGTNMPISLPSHTSLQQDLEEDEYIDSENGLIYCARCHTPRQGRYRLRLLGRDLTPRILCRCQMEERKILDEERARKEQMAKVSRLRASGLQNKFLHECRFEKDTLHSPQLAKARSYVENWDTMKKTGQGLLLWGPVGRGKTFFAGCIANALIDRCIPVLMTGIPDILSEFAALPPSERNHFIDSFDAYSLLILDDLGVERNSEYAAEQVFRLVDSRYRSKKPLIVTTNLTLDEMKKPADLAHERIFGRILENCSPLLMNGPNLREQKAAENLKMVSSFLCNTNPAVP